MTHWLDRLELLRPCSLPAVSAASQALPVKSESPDLKVVKNDLDRACCTRTRVCGGRIGRMRKPFDRGVEHLAALCMLFVRISSES